MALGQHPRGEILQAALQVGQAHGPSGDTIPSQDHRSDDLPIVSRDPLGEGQALKQIVEAVGVEYHADEVGLAGLVAADQHLTEHGLRPALVGLQLGQRDSRYVQLLTQFRQLSEFGVEVRLDPSDLALELGDAGPELSQLAILRPDRPREGRDAALAGADLLRDRALVRSTRRL